MVISRGGTYTRQVATLAVQGLAPHRSISYISYISRRFRAVDPIRSGNQVASQEFFPFAPGIQPIVALRSIRYRIFNILHRKGDTK